MRAYRQLGRFEARATPRNPIDIWNLQAAPGAAVPKILVNRALADKAGGLVMLTVVSRTREMGVRIALGARPRQIVWQVLGDALRPLVAATAAGTALAWLVLRSFRSVFYGVSPSDIATFGAACALLLVVAALAAFVPSRRAAQVDPVEALRGE